METPRLFEAIEVCPTHSRDFDPDFTEELKLGNFPLAGFDVTLGEVSVFDIIAPSAVWAAELHAFDWLRHLLGGNDDHAVGIGRDLVRDWVAHREHLPGAAHATSVIARRVTAWLCEADRLIEEVQDETAARIASSWDRDVAALRRMLRRDPVDADRLPAAVAVCMALSCSVGPGSPLRTAEHDLEGALRTSLGSGGLLRSRNLSATLDLLLDLTPLRQVYVARDLAVPAFLDRAMTTLARAVQTVCLGDGSLARFGTGEWCGYPHRLIPPPRRELQAAAVPIDGFVRLSAGRTVMVCDAAPPASGEGAAFAASSVLAFECSSGATAIFCNPPAVTGVVGPAARSSARHNALVVADASAVTFVPNAAGGLEADFDGSVHATQGVDAFGVAWVEASHTGYASRFGVVHHRRIALTDEGSAIHGIDRIEMSSDGDTKLVRAPSVVLHFHLASETSFAIGDDPGTLTLRLANDDAWRFSAGGLPIEIEAVPGIAGQRSAKVVHRLLVRMPAEMDRCVEWRLERVSAASDVVTTDDRRAPITAAWPALAVDRTRGDASEKRADASRPRLRSLRDALARVMGHPVSGSGHNDPGD